MTGAAVMGRRTYDMFEGGGTSDEFQVPIFVLTHAVPEKAVKAENDKLTLTFITDGIQRATQKAKAAAGDKDVMVRDGANTAQQCLGARLLDDQERAIQERLESQMWRAASRVGRSCALQKPIALENQSISFTTDCRTQSEPRGCAA